MIAVSRKRGYSADTIIETAVVMTNSDASRISGNRSQVHVGVDPPGEDEDEDHDEVQAEVQQGRQHHGQRDHQPRKLRLAHHRLLAHDRA